MPYPGLGPDEEEELWQLLSSQQGPYSQLLQQQLVQELNQPEAQPPDFSGAQNADSLLNIFRSIAEPLTSFNMGQGPAQFQSVHPAEQSAVRNYQMKQQTGGSNRLEILKELAKMELQGAPDKMAMFKMMFDLQKDLDAEMRGVERDLEKETRQRGYQLEDRSYQRENEITDQLASADRREMELGNQREVEEWKMNRERLSGYVPDDDPRIQPPATPNLSATIGRRGGSRGQELRNNPQISIPQESYPQAPQPAQQQMPQQGMQQPPMQQGMQPPMQDPYSMPGAQDNLGVAPVPPPAQLQQPAFGAQGMQPQLQAAHGPQPTRQGMQRPNVKPQDYDEIATRMAGVQPLAKSVSRLMEIIALNDGSVPGGGAGVGAGETLGELLGFVGTAVGAIKGGLTGALAGGAGGSAAGTFGKSAGRGMVSDMGLEVQAIMDEISLNIVTIVGSRVADSEKEKERIEGKYGLRPGDVRFDDRIAQNLPKLVRDVANSLQELKARSPEAYEHLRSQGIWGVEEFQDAMSKAQFPDSLIPKVLGQPYQEEKGWKSKVPDWMFDEEYRRRTGRY